MSKTNRLENGARCCGALSRWVSVGAAAAWLLAGSAQAAEPAAEPAGENANLDLARSVAVTGREAFNAGDYETALALFRRAFTLYPAPTVVLYEARTLEKMGLLLEAADAYLRTTQTQVPSDAPGQFAEAIAAARQEERALRTRIPTLTLRVDGVSANDPNLEVSINGRAIGAAQLDQAQRLNPGTYRIKGSIGGDRSDIAEVVLSEGQKASVALNLAAPSLSPPAPTVIHPAPTAVDGERPASPGDTLRLAAYISGGVGLVGLGGGIVTGLIAVKKHSQAESECQDNNCDPDGPGPGMVKDFQSMRTVSTVFYGVGAAGLAAGVVFWLVAPSASDASQAGAIRPWFDAHTVGVQGAF
ncbi:MAG TPA: hypothetical protein VFS67_19610 [Polyangiaceae bacterium]|jgi:hypothetical protein|nr:hypothetical protein [Polyangiaceae bacterium]